MSYSLRTMKCAAVSILLFAPPASVADDIDLQCNRTSADLVSRLDAAGLLASGHTALSQARAIAEEVRNNRQSAARQQQESDRKSLLSNILFEDTGGKPGNKRLLNLKH